jgi:hypothetical protein
MRFSLGRLSRYLFNRGGHGIHSPYVFNFFIDVIEEKRPYYCYTKLKSVQISTSEVDWVKTKCLLKKNGLKRKDYEFFFRVSNYIKPQRILVIGGDLGLVPLYLTEFSNDAHCMVIDDEYSVSVMKTVFEKLNKLSKVEGADVCLIDCLCSGDEKNPADRGFTDENLCIDLVYWSEFLMNDTLKISVLNFEKLSDNIAVDGVMIINGIRKNREAKEVWKKICCHEKVSVTIDLYSYGLVFFNPKLNKKTYKNII